MASIKNPWIIVFTEGRKLGEPLWAFAKGELSDLAHLTDTKIKKTTSLRYAACYDTEKKAKAAMKQLKAMYKGKFYSVCELTPQDLRRDRVHQDEKQTSLLEPEEVSP